MLGDAGAAPAGRNATQPQHQTHLTAAAASRRLRRTLLPVVSAGGGAAGAGSARAARLFGGPALRCGTGVGTKGVRAGAVVEPRLQEPSARAHHFRHARHHGHSLLSRGLQGRNHVFCGRMRTFRRGQPHKRLGSSLTWERVVLRRARSL